MCRAWPGFRCSNHPSKKVRQSARRLWKAEQRHEAATEAVEAFAAEHGEDWANEPGAATLIQNQKEAATAVEAERKGWEEDRTEYNLTLKGREELVQQEQSEDPKEAATAAAERNAAEQRIEEQKRIARVLQNPEVNLPQKVWVAQSSARQTKKELDALKASYSETTHELEALLRERASRQKRGSDLNAEQKEELARLMKEQARLAERIKQTEAHYEAVMAWLNRTLEKGWDDALNLNEKFGHRLIDVLI